MIRVYELANELGLRHTELVARIRTLGYPVSNHMSKLDTDAEGRVREHLERERQENVVEVQVSRSVFRRRQKSRPEPAAPVEPEVRAEAMVVEAPPPPPPPPAAPPAPPTAPPPAEVAPPTPEEVAAPPAEVAPPEPEPRPQPTPLPATPRVEAPPMEPAKRPAQPRRQAGPGAAVVHMPSPEELARRQAVIQEEQRRKEQLTARRRRTAITKTDLFKDAARFQKGAQRKKKKVVSKKGQKTQLTTPKATKRIVKVEGGITIGDLAKQMSVKAADVLKTLISMGTMATINQVIDVDTATLIANEFGYEVQDVAFQEADVLEVATDEDEELAPRAAVVTVMGHVDHGKTSLLDRIRNTDVAAGEAGGITQHIGAYNVRQPKGKGKGNIVFLDTPGHEAFTSMRARGAQCTDIVILVVAADDGVMPQTLEAINHSKAAGVPIVVAVNKVDRENANPERVRHTVSEHELVPEEWGGDTQFVDVSAKTGQGVDDLLEATHLLAEMQELKANPKRKAQGVILEARLETGRGAVATVLVQAGTLKVGDIVVVGAVMGRVRAMTDEQGRKLKKAGPSTPVEIIGLQGVPDAGDILHAVKSEKNAKAVVEHRQERTRQADLARRSAGVQDLAALLGQEAVKELKVIVKADVQGSVEAVRDALVRLSTEKVKLTSIHEGVGALTESDINLAAAANRDAEGTAVLAVAFNLRTPRKVADLAEQEGVDVRHYEVIYDAVEETRQAMAGLLAPRYEERFVGRAEVRATFVIPKQGTVAGCMVTDGKIQRGIRCRLLRDDVVVWKGRVGSLRRFKDDAKEVQSGFECGVGLEGYNDVKMSDVIEVFEMDEVAATLED